MAEQTHHPSSFRDPSGFIFERKGILYRQVNKIFSEDYRLLKQSGLYNALAEKGWLIPHEELEENLTGMPEWFITLVPKRLSLISFPYEWCFGQLQDAALLHLQIMRMAIEHGMILKDATPFNIQFANGKPILIDTLSFERFDASKPWIAYRQYCETFLFPLLLQHYNKSDSIRWLRLYLNGIPVELTAQLLPFRSRLNLGTWMHVFLQRSVKQRRPPDPANHSFSKVKMLQLLDHLETMTRKLRPGEIVTSTWHHYYESTILGRQYLDAKSELFREFISDIPSSLVHDMGANDGHFTKILAQAGHQVLASDADASCMQRLFDFTKQSQVTNILPLTHDITNPSPGLGIANRERASFDDRFHPQLVVALALIHHLAIAQNISLELLADYFSSIAPQLIIEFVPKSDPKVKELLQGRRDIFHDYDEGHFENKFKSRFSIARKQVIAGTERILYKMIRI